MGYDQYLQAMARTVSWRVVLRLDYCALTCGASPCAASGPPYCYYTYPTCRDPEHYTRSSRNYCFTRAEGAAVPDSLPYLKDIKTVPTEIVPKDSMTRRARITLDFFDDAPLALANPDKTVSNPETRGTFFRNLMARNPNAVGREAEIWQGFAGLPLSEYRLAFRGVIDKLEWEEGRTRIVIKDQLKLLDQKIPRKQSSNNVLTSAYSGGATMNVTNGLEFDIPGTVKLGNEYVDFTGRDATTLTGCAPGRYGTSSVSHGAGTAAKQVVIFAEPADGDGLPPDEVFLSLLCIHGGMDPLAMAVVDRGAQLDGGTSAEAEALDVTITDPFPETGVVRIGDELVRYRGISGATLSVVERGAYGTAAAAHDDGDAVVLTRLTEDLGRWWAGTRYRRLVENQVAVKDLVNELRELTVVHIWQAEDSSIAAKCVAPPFFTDAPRELDDESGFIADGSSWDPGLDLRVSRISVYYDPVTAEPGKKPDGYNGVLVLLDAEAESADYFAEARAKDVFSPWIYREHEAVLLASRSLIRYRCGAATLQFSLELKDDGLGVGDFVRINSRDVIEASGEPRPRALFEILKKQRVSDGRIEFTAVDTRLDRRYPVIAPAGFGGEYDAAGADDQERYGWIGDDDNRVGAGDIDGYYIY